jgi:hypothetical protein
MLERLEHRNLIHEVRVFEAINTKLPRKPDSDPVSVTVGEIKNKRIKRFEPSFRLDGGVTYTGFSDRDFARQLDILRSLRDLGIVKEEAFDYVRKCSHCDHYGLMMKVACPACGATNTVQGRVIEHLRCGHIDLESNFISRDGEGMMCAKCKKRLKAVGVDYVRPGSYSLCQSCNSISPYGNMQFVCLNCARSQTKDELKVEPLFAYNVDVQALSKYMDQSDQDYQTLIVRALEKVGLRAVPGAGIQGSSQVQHNFDVLVYKDDNTVPVLVIEIEKSKVAVESEAILNFIARSLDAKVPKKILVAKPGLAEDAKRLADTYGIITLESAGSEPEEVARKVARIVKGEEGLGGETYLEELLEEVIDEDKDEQRKKRKNSDPDLVGLEKMLKLIMNSARDDDKDVS